MASKLVYALKLLFVSIVSLVIFFACPSTTSQMVKTETSVSKEKAIPAQNMIVEMASYKGQDIKDVELSVTFYKTAFYGSEMRESVLRKSQKDSVLMRNKLLKGLGNKGNFTEVGYFPKKLGQVTNVREFNLPDGSSFRLNLPEDGEPIETKSKNTYFLVMDTLGVVLDKKSGFSPQGAYEYANAMFVTNFAFWDNSSGNVITFGRVKARKSGDLGGIILQKSPFKK